MVRSGERVSLPRHGMAGTGLEHVEDRVVERCIGFGPVVTTT